MVTSIRSGFRVIAVVALLLGAVAVTGALAKEPDREGADPGAPTRRTIQEIEGLLRDIRLGKANVDLRSAEGRALLEKAVVAPDRLRRILGEYPAAWARARPTLLDLLETASERDVLDRVLEVLAEDRDAQTRRALGDRLATYPDAIPLTVLLLLDERGEVPESRSCLVDRLELDTIPASMVARKRLGHRDYERVLAAAHLAMRRSEGGREILEAFLSAGPNALNNPWVYGAAATGLHFLGAKDAWDRAVSAASEEMEVYVESGDLEASRRVVLRLDYFHPAVTSGKPVSLDHLVERVRKHVSEHAPEIDTLDAVRKRLENLRCAAPGTDAIGMAVEATLGSALARAVRRRTILVALCTSGERGAVTVLRERDLTPTLLRSSTGARTVLDAIGAVACVVDLTADEEVEYPVPSAGEKVWKRGRPSRLFNVGFQGGPQLVFFLPERGQVIARLDARDGAASVLSAAKRAAEAVQRFRKEAGR